MIALISESDGGDLMSKIRVYELAKQLKISNKDLLEALSNLDISVKNHMSSLTEEEVDKVIKSFTAKKNNDNKTKTDTVSKNVNKNSSNQPKAEEVKKDQQMDIPKATSNNKTTASMNTSNNGQNSSNTNNKQDNRNNKRRNKYSEEIAAPEDVELIEIPDTITVKDLSLKLNRQVSELVKAMLLKGIMVTANQEIDFATAAQIAEEFDVLVEKMEEVDILEDFFKEEPDLEENLTKRSPVVVVMGHVDHGKTSLLDAFRKSNVTEQEQGGITQHIGASVITVNNEKITFLDTPGHEAFTAMRLRGAMATDIAILVVAADDGVMPQTVEAINHAKAAGVQIIIAVNKIDKPGANPDRVKQELVEYGLVAEDWGGDTICVPVSAIAKTNLDQLLEMIILVSEMEEYKANANKKARGIVIESQLDKGRGPVATVLVQEGTLKVGDAIVAGSSYGKIRAMVDDKGRRVKQAGPSTPVEVLGLSEAPMSGEVFYTAKDERQARRVAEKVQERTREKMIQHTPHKVTLDDLFTQIQAGEMKELKLIVKADVQGSVEAVKQSLVKLSNEEVMINVIHGGVGAVNESDVMLASASNAIIIGFNVRPETTAREKADLEEIDIRLYRVIYNAIEDIEAAMKGMLDPIFEEKVIGHAEIRQTFKVSGVGTIGGSYILDGKFTRNAQARIVRDGIVVFEGELASLKRFKDDVKEVNTGYECGIMLEKYNDIKEGDIVEAFIMEEIPR
jgi:translation initiation factor IF-2